MSIEYTDIENTGLPAVPELNSATNDDTDRFDFLSETVWSHRLDQPTERSQ